MKMGGHAEWLLEPKNPDEFHLALTAARGRGHRVRVLGAGADLLVEDGLHAGTVISTSRVDRIFRPGLVETETPFDACDESINRMAPAAGEDDPRLVAWCGASLPGLVRKAGELGWSGLEGLVGVPGKVGGAVATNAGGRWGEIWEVIESLRVLNAEGVVVDLDRDQCNPTYRDGRLGDLIVVGVVFRLVPESKTAVQDRGRQFLLEKNAVQPVTESCAGCIFKNPDREVSDGRSAGQLIDQLGLKGTQRGAALVSPLHGNFILNTGGVRSADVFGLIDEIRDRVADKTAIVLEPEVRSWRI